MKSIEIPGLVQGSEEWKRWRATGLGGSDTPIIMSESGNLYGKTPLALWREKCGYAEAQFDAAAQVHTKRGHEREPAARAEFIRRTGIFIEPVCMQSSTHPFMLASMDGMNATRDVGCEIKAPAEKMFGLMLSEGTPIYYADQIQHQIFVSGAREFYFFAFNPDIAPYIYIQRHEPNHSRIQEILRRCQALWRHVEMNIAPSDELGVSKSNIGKLGITMFAGYAKVGKDTLGLVHHNLFKTSRYAFADPLKEMYCKMKKFTLADLEFKKDKLRPELVALGQGMREIDPDVWVNGVFNARDGIYEVMANNGAFITDTRYVNEVSHGRKHAERLGVPFRLIWVERPGVGPANEMERDFTSLLRAMSDTVLVNDADGTTEVGRKALEMALVYAMGSVPKGLAVEVKASSLIEMATQEVSNEPKRTGNRKKANASNKK